MQKYSSLFKLIFTCSLCIVLIGLIILRKNDIVTIFTSHILVGKHKITIEEKNDYYRNQNFMLVKNINDFYPVNYQDIINIYYTFLNSGQVSFTFYCPAQYESCLEDIQRLAKNEDILASINNYVHPYNSFSHIETNYDTLGKVTISIVKNYTSDEIEKINQKVEELLPELTTDNEVIEDDIRNIHDYIINNTRYDSEKSQKKASPYNSDSAYGPLFEGYGICGGYADLMEIFLEKLGVKNFKVSTQDHVWNAVKLGDNWYHLDLTWDDPVSSDGKDYLEYDYFLITTEKLREYNDSEHKFDEEYYPELKGTSN